RPGTSAGSRGRPATRWPPPPAPVSPSPRPAGRRAPAPGALRVPQQRPQLLLDVGGRNLAWEMVDHTTPAVDDERFGKAGQPPAVIDGGAACVHQRVGEVVATGEIAGI